MRSLELPTDYLDMIALADWVELQALGAADQNMSAGDLQDALQIVIGSSRAEELTIETFLELEDRLRAAGEAYPFAIVRGRILQAKPDFAKHIAYIFCLFLSYFGWKPERGDNTNPRLLFEDLCCVAARQYLQGSVYQFGTSRRSGGVASFSEAVKELCILLGEGTGIRPINTLNKKDDHVDLVAWRSFSDGRESKLILFGQCASGDNWEDKVSELQPDFFWSHWMQESQISPFCRSFFIPHRIAYEDGEKWRYITRYAGVFFDRCRVAHFAWMDNDKLIADTRYSEWCNSVFPIGLAI